jgi:DNA-binding transcriptional LysR family regulator
MYTETTMKGLTLQQLQCFDAVVAEGGYQAAAERLGRTHPTVFTAVRNLEAQIGFALFDRSGYRAALTDAGHAFHARTRALLHELDGLCDEAAQLAAGEEASLSVVIGDLCPLAPTLGLLRRFFDSSPATRLDLQFEAITGPNVRLMDGTADLILHYVDKTDPRVEFIDLMHVVLIPVVAPGFLRFEIDGEITPERMRPYAQCVIRDSAPSGPSQDYYLIEGARRWTVSDQLMKKELVVQGMGWGHMPAFLIEDELADGRLLSIEGQAFRRRSVPLVAARRRDKVKGPVAERLWRHIGERAAA